MAEAYTLRTIPMREDLNTPEVLPDPEYPQRKAIEACPLGQDRQATTGEYAGELKIRRGPATIGQTNGGRRSALLEAARPTA